MITFEGRRVFRIIHRVSELRLLSIRSPSRRGGGLRVTAKRLDNLKYFIRTVKTTRAAIENFDKQFEKLRPQSVQNSPESPDTRDRSLL